MNDTISYIVLFIVIIVAFVVAPQFRMRRAISRVISGFRQAGAIDVGSAKTLDELGLRRMFTATPSLLGGGDPFQTALQTLKDARIVQSTADGKLYLSESNLASSKWRDRPRDDSSKERQ